VRFLAFVAALLASGASAAAQSATAIDFARDVRPIFEAHCVRCHGPEQQMGGLRLDRRADALRGGSQSDIGPGNADGSRLYHRLIGTNFGPRMPLGEASLSDDQIEIIKRWIDEGTPWPDAVSGETPPLPIDPEANQLVTVFRDGSAAAIRAAIADVSKNGVNGRGAGGMTPLMAAALYGDSALVKRLVAVGGHVDATSPGGATALMWAVPDTAKMRVLLDAGADADARTDDGRTALVIASGTAGAASAVRLLLEYGADATASGDVTPLREAARVNDVAIFQLLLTSGGVSPASVQARYVRSTCAKCAAVVHAGDPLPKEPPESDAAATAPLYDPSRLAIPTPIGPTPVTTEAIRAAVMRTLPLLQQVSAAFVRQTGCASCHHNSLVSLATAAARAHGFLADEALTKPAASFMPPYLESWRERALQNIPIAGGADTVSYLLVGMAADGYAPDAASDAQAIGLARRQQIDGHWALQSLRPPIESNDIEVTAMSMRAVQLFAPPTRHAETTKAVDRARAWLEKAVPLETEEVAFKLLGLTWAGAQKPVVSTAARELMAAQRDDGGWSQSERRASDAYATGQALVALRESGISSSDPAIRRGVAFLLRTQFEDGTWFVESRSVPIQAYFESGFPFGRNQWISAAASAWATWALVLAE
jgi:hypothetical protein